MLKRVHYKSNMGIIQLEKKTLCTVLPFHQSVSNSVPIPTTTEIWIPIHTGFPMPCTPPQVPISRNSHAYYAYAWSQHLHHNSLRLGLHPNRSIIVNHIIYIHQHHHHQQLHRQQQQQQQVDINTKIAYTSNKSFRFGDSTLWQRYVRSRSFAFLDWIIEPFFVPSVFPGGYSPRRQTQDSADGYQHSGHHERSDVRSSRIQYRTCISKQKQTKKYIVYCENRKPRQSENMTVKVGHGRDRVYATSGTRTGYEFHVVDILSECSTSSSKARRRKLIYFLTYLLLTRARYSFKNKHYILSQKLKIGI